MPIVDNLIKLVMYATILNDFNWFELQHPFLIFIYRTFIQQKNVYKRQHKDYCEIKLYTGVGIS
jgi:hypothetical protein